MPRKATKDVETTKDVVIPAKKLVKKVAKKTSITKKSIKDSSNLKIKKDVKKEKEIKVKKTTSPKVNSKVLETKKEILPKTKKTVKKSEPTEKLVKKIVKKTDLKTATEVKKTPVKKKTEKKETTSKKVVAKKTSTVKSKKTKQQIFSSEFYELPYAYNQTIVKILAQTPNSLFIYWDISTDDIQSLKNIYGDDFLDKTRPVLIISNQTKGYKYETTINDFANSWYLHIGDTKCKYSIELGRKFNEYRPGTNYIYLTSSNVIETPNDHILHEKEQHMLYYYNLKTKQLTSTKALTFIQNMGKIYGTYKDIKGDSIIKDDIPSSGGFYE